MISVRNNYARGKSIDIDVSQTITLSLSGKEYDELITELNLSMAEKVKSSDAIVKEALQKREKCVEFIDDIRDVFYEMSDDIGFMRELNEIDRSKLTALLEKYKAILGFR